MSSMKKVRGRSSTPKPRKIYEAPTPTLTKMKESSSSRNKSPSMKKRKNSRSSSAASGELSLRSMTKESFADLNKLWKSLTSSSSRRSTSRANRNRSWYLNKLWKELHNNVRPWPEFFFPLSAPESMWWWATNIKTNLMYFQINYAVLFLSYLGFQLMTSWTSVWTIAFLLGIWSAFLKKSEDPKFFKKVFPIKTNPAQRWMLMLFFTLALILFSCGQIIFTSCLFFGFCSLVHASLHGY